jgi:acyl-coenzyme A synthetase/AMP-(fatty) acid ligase
MDAYETEYYEELIARHEEVVEAMVVAMADKMDNEVDELMAKEK